jgi:hypothetical protein
MRMGINREQNRALFAPKRGDTVRVAEYGQCGKQKDVGSNSIIARRRGLLGKVWETLKEF